ncbi:MAG: inorganic pyrophosphatase [Phycisphaerales bacterium]
MSPYQAFRPHPWHGLPVGPDPPERVHAFVEITPFDLVKYEVDKLSGYLRIDRPQRTSSTPPTIYGFIPRTLCGRRVAALASTDRSDGDPLDICVLSERPINRSEILLEAQVVGGLLMLDRGEADDKVVAVLRDDPIWSGARDISELPPALVERLQHYFSTYKLRPGEPSRTEIRLTYGRERAMEVVRAAMADYGESWGGGL